MNIKPGDYFRLDHTVYKAVNIIDGKHVVCLGGLPFAASTPVHHPCKNQCSCWENCPAKDEAFHCFTLTQLKHELVSKLEGMLAVGE
jgi:hypothetical protein